MRDRTLFEAFSGHLRPVLASILIGCLVLFAIASLTINGNRHAQQNERTNNRPLAILRPTINNPVRLPPGMLNR
jgi:hypothetical protein